MTQFYDVVKSMDDDELVICVDEYIKRIIARARSMEYKGALEISVSAQQYTPNNDFTIDHKVSFGYGKGNVECNNALDGVARLVNRWREDQGYQPITVSLMLPPPPPTRVEEVEDAEFSEGLVDNSTRDEVPF